MVNLTDFDRRWSIWLSTRFSTTKIDFFLLSYMHPIIIEPNTDFVSLLDTHSNQDYTSCTLNVQCHTDGMLRHCLWSTQSKLMESNSNMANGYKACVWQQQGSLYKTLLRKSWARLRGCMPYTHAYTYRCSTSRLRWAGILRGIWIIVSANAQL